MINRFSLNRLNGGAFMGGGSSAALAARKKITLAAEPLLNSGAGRLRAGPGLPDVTAANLLTFARASLGYDFNSSNVLSSYATNALRQGNEPVTGLPAGFLLEQASTNGVRNPRNEGSTTGLIGSGGAWPTNWSLLYGSSGLSVQIVGTGSENGIPYLDVRYFGTATSSGFPGIIPDTFTNIAAANAQTWTSSVFIKLQAGALTGLTIQPGWQYMDNIGSQLQFFQATVVPTGAALATQRTAVTNTTANATTTNVIPFLVVSFNNAAVVDCTLRIGGFQIEQVAGTTSLILPPALSPAATTRAIDALSITGAAFTNIFGNGAPTGWCIVDVMMPAAITGTARYLFDITDGTNNNRMGIRTSTGGTVVTGGGALAGSGTQSSNISFTGYGSVARFGLRWNATGYDVSYNGAAPITTAQAKVAHNRLVVGNTNNGASPLNGRITNLWGGAIFPADTKFRAATTNGANVETIMKGP